MSGDSSHAVKARWTTAAWALQLFCISSLTLFGKGEDCHGAFDLYFVLDR